MKSFDVVVIGAGLAGLSSAAALAAAGQRVAVLEQYTVVGGSTHVFRRKGKWEWQVGVHHLGDCGPDGDMPTVFRGLGLAEHITYERMNDDGYERAVFPDLVFDVPMDWDEFESRAVTAFPGERRKIHRFFAATRSMATSIDRMPASTSLRGTLTTAVKAGVRAPLAVLPLSTVMDLYGLSERLQLLLSVSPCGSLDAPPDRLPFAAYCIFWNNFVAGGSWFPHGGGQVFASQLLRVIEHYGGEIVTDAAVDQILVEHAAATGVRLQDGTIYRAGAVISTADIKKTYNSLIPEHSRRASDTRRVGRYRMASPFFNAYLGADVDLVSLYPNRDHFSIPTWTKVADIEQMMQYRVGDTAQSWLDRVSPVLPAYVHCSNLKDPTSTRYAPAGSSSLEVMTPVALDHRLWGTTPETWRDHEYTNDSSYTLMKERLTDVMIERARRVMPELDGTISHREAATPITQERFTQSTAGASYGIEFNTRQFGIRRPGPKTHVKGLFLAGASCQPGPATEGVLLSGMQTAGAILGRDLLAEFRAGRPLVPATTLSAVPSDWDPLAAAKPRRRAAARMSTVTDPQDDPAEPQAAATRATSVD